MKHLPNILTCMNLLCGAVAVTLAFGGQMPLALVLLCVAALFDFADGLAARLLHAPSALGKELDSLADVVSFCFLPSAMLFVTYRPFAPRPWMAYVCFLFLVAGALRLARFNVDTTPRTHFVGLPTPASALTMGTAVVAAKHLNYWQQLMHTTWFIPCLVLLFSFLMVSRLPFFSFKVKQWTVTALRLPIQYVTTLAVLVVVGLILGWHWTLLVLVAVLLYFIFSFTHLGKKEQGVR